MPSLKKISSQDIVLNATEPPLWSKVCKPYVELMSLWIFVPLIFQEFSPVSQDVWLFGARKYVIIPFMHSSSQAADPGP